ncbi:integral membrane protein TerC family-domain-containing protein [Pelagophyceae sp. CCMP2097]|nr:integral membrane protein TerC family-domain-containing protein [Pelagophyceae sp. CCMP2097]
MLLATLFGLGLGAYKGRQACQEFFAGYLVEQSLSVDNLFVFIMLFEYFQVPQQHQQRVLTWGIIGAVAMRGIMIVAGVAAVRRFKWMTLLFAAILFLSSVKLLMENDDDADLSENGVMRLSRYLVGATSEYDGDKFFTERRDDSAKTGRRRHKKVATPLLLCLVCVELSDVVFAVDSIPAVLGISTDPFVVYSSNIFAILGLRTLYTLVARAVDQMQYLKPAVCLVLVFISLKMILEYFDYHLSTAFSLCVVCTCLTTGCVLSVFAKKKSHKKRDPPEATLRRLPGAARDEALLHRRAGGLSHESDLERVNV